MGSDWCEVRLGDVLTLQRGFDLPTRLRQVGRVPIISSSGVTDFHSESKVAGPGVVTGRYGTIGRVFYIQEDYWPLNTTLFVKDFKGNNPLFVSYLLRTIDFDSCNDKSSVPGVNRNHLHMLPVRLPPLDQQREIAHILGSLDDKIALNRKMNRTLEAMARALFKSWFVDFDPVRARAEGRTPTGMDADTAALFPNAFEDSPLGQVPKGWRVSVLADLCTTQYGYTARATNEPVGPKFLRVMDINKQPWIEWPSVPHSLISDTEYARYRLSPGDIVVARMADPGKSAIIEDDVEAVFASYLVRLKCASFAMAEYIYGYLQSPQYAEYSAGAKSGSVQANMNAKVITGARLVVPPVSLVDAFCRAVLPMRKRIGSNVRETGILAATRDALLPRLMNGDIPIAFQSEVAGG